MALVYRHLKPDGTTFYIGIGVSKKEHILNTVEINIGKILFLNMGMKCKY